MSSMSKAPSSIDITSESPEESGWTKYFEDFCNNDNDDDKCSISSDFASSSLVSDAASSLMAAKKLASADRELQAQEFVVDKNGNRSSLKRKKTKAALVDDSLEDTASSPVNSHKEKGSTSGKGNERKELGFNGRENDCTELKKKGLCLVPLSMVVNFLG